MLPKIYSINTSHQYIAQKSAFTLMPLKINRISCVSENKQKKSQN